MFSEHEWEVVLTLFCPDTFVLQIQPSSEVELVNFPGSPKFPPRAPSRF